MREEQPAEPRIVPAEEISLPTLAMEKLSLEDPRSRTGRLLNRILATVLERQLAADECIEISQAAARTARYDRNKEAGLQDVKVVPVGAHVKEEFYNRYIEKKEPHLALEFNSLNSYIRLFVSMSIFKFSLSLSNAYYLSCS